MSSNDLLPINVIESNNDCRSDDGDDVSEEDGKYDDNDEEANGDDDDDVDGKKNVGDSRHESSHCRAGLRYVGGVYS